MCPVPGAVMSRSHVYPHFKDEETQGQRGRVIPKVIGSESVPHKTLLTTQNVDVFGVKYLQYLFP